MIRLAMQKDLVAINDIYTQAIHAQATADITPISMPTREAWFTAHPADQFPIFVYEINTKVVAWLSITAYRPGRMALYRSAEISYYVDEQFLQQGIASQLLEYALAQASKLQLDTFIAIILENNLASIALMKKFGFTQWGHLPDVAEFDGKRVGHVYYGWQLPNLNL
jgi:phosphinothricin acetyltransferase